MTKEQLEIENELKNYLTEVIQDTDKFFELIGEFDSKVSRFEALGKDRLNSRIEVIRKLIPSVSESKNEIDNYSKIKFDQLATPGNKKRDEFVIKIYRYIYENVKRDNDRDTLKRLFDVEKARYSDKKIKYYENLIKTAIVSIKTKDWAEYQKQIDDSKSEYNIIKGYFKDVDRAEKFLKKAQKIEKRKSAWEEWINFLTSEINEIKNEKPVIELLKECVETRKKFLFRPTEKIKLQCKYLIKLLDNEISKDEIILSDLIETTSLNIAEIGDLFEIAHHKKKLYENNTEVIKNLFLALDNGKINLKTFAEYFDRLFVNSGYQKDLSKKAKDIIKDVATRQAKYLEAKKKEQES